MEPPAKAVSIPATETSPFEDPEYARQSGRSSTSLSAERSAASLRSSENRTKEVAAGAPDAQETVGSTSTGPNATRDNRNPTPAWPLPSTPSPLTSRGSADSIENGSASKGKESAADARKSANASPRRPKTAGSMLSPRMGASPRLQSRSLARMSRPELGRELDSRRSSSVLSIQDLGSDYTRYFSFTGATPKTPPLRYNSPSRSQTPRAGAALANPFLTPNASTTRVDKDYADSEAEKGFLVDDRLSAPYDEKGAMGWPLISDEAEDDDDMHMPMPDDDIRFKPRWKDHFSRGNIASTIGLVFMILGLLFVFVALPVLSAVGIIDYNSSYGTPLDQMPKFYPPPESWATVNDLKYPLMSNIRTSLIDKDTPKSARTMTGEFGDEYVLVFSDEFNKPNRTFYEGDDPYWTAPDIWYGATQDLEWYDPDAATTWDGTLELRLDAFPNHGLQYRSGMLNSWNQVCFKGGIFEVSMSLPGPAAVMGLWPGAWTMGNLGRPGYLSTTEGLWPYTYQACDVGITPNQSQSDGLSYLPGQKLPSCTCPGEDHPTPGTGRGAPEIDIVEAGASYGGLPIATQSYQVAPFDIWWHPDYEFTAFPDLSISCPNGYTGGPFQQAVSATTNLNRNWYDGKQYQRYSFEYVPGEGEGSYIVWKVGGETTFLMDGRAIGPNGNIQARQVSLEPMSMILNLGYSTSWTEIKYDLLKFPTVMRVDYVRWYQKKGEEMVTCDPPGFETTKYIEEHKVAYTNPNLTKWDQTGFPWPKHKLNSKC